MFNSSGALVWRGVLALIIGIIAIVWPGITVEAFVLLFAVYAFIAAGTRAVQAFSSDRAGPVVGGLLLAVLDVAAGVVAIGWPGITALALVWVVAIWALAGGLVEVMLAFSHRQRAGRRALLGLGGLVSIALGVVLAIRPDIGAFSLAEVYGLFSIVTGVSLLVVAANVGSVSRELGYAGPVRTERAQSTAG